MTHQNPLAFFRIIFCCGVLLYSVAGVSGDAYVGSQRCAECHQSQYQSWSVSDHSQAMASADEDSVLANFDNATFNYLGKTTRFYRQDGGFWVRTEGADGEATDYQIRYTLGYSPLQQYIVAFPNGHYQALSIAWDSRAKAEGGQRWFHLYPDEQIDFKDPLHWTGPYQKWNSMCASCHVTAWSKNYDVGTKSYRSGWSELGVGCEACHGPGAGHIEAADNGFAEGNKHIINDTRAVGRWALGEGQNIAHITGWVSAFGTGEKGMGQKGIGLKGIGQMNQCLGCHSRRTAIASDKPGGEYLDAYTPTLLSPPLYELDGQVHDEVFVGGSYLQSAMFHRGVTCGNCHDVHSGGLKGEREHGLDGPCLQCHRAESYASASHHHHQSGSAGSFCVDCHMPNITFMVVDPRRDHSLRIPDPQLSVDTGVPNACDNCHREQGLSWAAKVVDSWADDVPVATNNRSVSNESKTRGVGLYRRFAESRNTGNLKNDAAARQEQLRLAGDGLTPGIIKASVLSEFRPRSQPELDALAAGARDPDPLVRVGACRGYATVPLQLRKVFLWPLLEDPVKSVRLAAFRALSRLPASQLSESEQALFNRAKSEYLQAQLIEADKAGAWLNIAEIHLNQGDFPAAQSAYREALALEPSLVPALLNLADLYRLTNRDSLGKELLEQALTVAPRDAGAHYVYALWLVRGKDYERGVRELLTAINLDPTNGRYAYVYAVAVSDLNGAEAALKFARNVVDSIDDPEPLLSFMRDTYARIGEPQKAEETQRRIDAYRGK